MRLSVRSAIHIALRPTSSSTTPTTDAPIDNLDGLSTETCAQEAPVPLLAIHWLNQIRVSSRLRGGHVPVVVVPMPVVCPVVPRFELWVLDLF